VNKRAFHNLIKTGSGHASSTVPPVPGAAALGMTVPEEDVSARKASQLAPIQDGHACGALQVSSEHYSSQNYDEFHRWMSYWYQIQSVARNQPQTVLEIGAGSGVLSSYLRTQLRLEVTTFDFDKSLRPDLIGDVRGLDSYVPERGFDAVVAFQVLEHLPFDDFIPTLQQLARASGRSVIFSLPHYGYDLQIRFRLRKWNWGFGRKISKNPVWSFDGEHYWEIATRGHSLSRVRQAVGSVLKIRRDYFCPDYPYHYFFECGKRTE